MKKTLASLSIGGLLALTTLTVASPEENSQNDGGY